ncbi:MAG: indolepyruvate ferredoxin oxidoreductase subunit alpha [Promethearchaeia archaeon]
MNEEKIYWNLKNHLDSLPVGFPTTDSGLELEILKLLFPTKQQAQLATYLKMVPEPPWLIYLRVKRRMGITYKELKRLLREMDKNGVIYGKKRIFWTYYRNQILAVGMYEFQINRIKKDPRYGKEFMDKMYQYHEEAFGEELIKTDTYQSRIVPVERSVPHKNFTPRYEDIRNLIERNEGKMTIADCVCRVGHDRMGEPCSQTDLRESCFIFGDAADYYVDHDFGRYIEKKEAFEILEKAEEDGLVLQAGNSQNMNFICTCCACCCGALQAAKMAPNTAAFYQTNYYAEINQNLCTGCKTCLDRCQADALTNKDEKARVDLENCIGCGLCVTTCPVEAISLKKTGRGYQPPKGAYRLFFKIMKERLGRSQVLKTVFNAVFRTGFIYIIAFLLVLISLL